MKTSLDSDAQTDAPIVGNTSQPLFINRSFGLLWIGQTISAVGSHITSSGLQLAAVLVLGATPLQMSLLAALGSAPALLIGLLAGVWVDRLPRRPILIVADLGRALLLLSIPLAALLGWLRIEQIYVVTALVGLFSVFFEVAYRSFLPTLLRSEQLVEGNSRLSASESLAEIGGPSLAGLLVQAITAPMAILFDSCSFLLSSLCIVLIHVPEPAPAAVEGQPALWKDVREGWRGLLGNSSLRALAACSATWNFCGGTFATLYTLYVVRTLGLAPVVYGLLVTMGGIGALLGALIASREARRIGFGSLLIGSILLHGTMSLLTPLAGGPGIMVIVILMISQLAGDLGAALYFINEISLRQAITPERLLGRVNACLHFLVGGSMLIGSLVAVVVSELIGIRLTLAAGACGMALSAIWLLLSPLYRLRRLPVMEGHDVD